MKNFQLHPTCWTLGARLLLMSMLCVVANNCSAQHRDVLLQEVEGQVVPGGANFDTSSWVLGPRVFNSTAEEVSQFGFSYFATNSPGFNARNADRPIGSQTLPGSTAVDWDFLPMYAAGERSNLLYWDGTGDVNFSVAIDSKLNIAGMNTTETQQIFADITPHRTIGSTLEMTQSDGTLHQHQDFSLFSGDFALGQPPGDYRPADGVYLIAMEMQIGNLLPADPIFVLLSTPSIASTITAEATAWVETQVDNLVLEGDYNNDGAVDLADYTVWRDTLASTTDLRANGDNSPASEGVVDHADYVVWQTNFGHRVDTASLASATNAVPEPAAWVLAATCSLAITATRRLRQ